MPGQGFYKEIWHLTISLVRSCQYVSACQKLSKYSMQFKTFSCFHKLITEGNGDYRALLHFSNEDASMLMKLHTHTGHCYKICNEF